MSSGALSTEESVSLEEVQLAARNHGMPLEGLRYAITPIGLHYLLIHFDIPFVDVDSWRLSVGGQVRRPLELTLGQVQAYPSVTMAVTMECAGNGRARLSPRPRSQPWLNEAVGTALWTGTRLRGILEQAEPVENGREVVFSGMDRGVQDGVDHYYERSLALDAAMREDVLLAYAINGQPLPPQHGFPLRLIVPGWYGMAQVKWLRSIMVEAQPFTGFQQEVKYRFRESEGDPGVPVTRIMPRSLMIPPGVPDFMSRTRFLPPGRHLLQGRAWSGWAPIARVDVSVDRGLTWIAAALGDPVSPSAWVAWEYAWEPPAPGEYELWSRATDASGKVQPVDQAWNVDGVGNNMAQRVRVVVLTA